MKTLSLKLDDAIFEETEQVVAEMKLARNRYINEALELYNKFNKRQLLKKQLAGECQLVASDSMEILREFEKFTDEV